MKESIRKVGIMGGGLMQELGPLKDVVLFFDCLNYFVVDRFPAQDWSLLTDRLYRRYLRRDELEPAAALMRKVKMVLDNTRSSEVQWIESIQGDRNKTWLNAKQDTLGMVFLEYFFAFDRVVDCTISDSDSFGGYRALRFSISNLFYFSMEEMRPLSQYEELGAGDEPFWLMPESIAYKFLEEKK